MQYRVATTVSSIMYCEMYCTSIVFVRSHDYVRSILGAEHYRYMMKLFLAITAYT